MVPTCLHNHLHCPSYLHRKRGSDLQGCILEELKPKSLSSLPNASARGEAVEAKLGLCQNRHPNFYQNNYFFLLVTILLILERASKNNQYVNFLCKVCERRLPDHCFKLWFPWYSNLQCWNDLSCLLSHPGSYGCHP
jgi:hypothetical protein